MVHLERIPERYYRVTGCFLPEDIVVLDRVFKEVLGELRLRDGAAAADCRETRTRLACLIISAAKRGSLDPLRLKAEALEAIGGGLLRAS